jgi:hypothetical protein
LERNVRFGDEQMEFVIIPPGEFMKGNPQERGALPQPTKIDKPFYMARFTVTQRQWKATNGKLTPDLERMKGDAPVKGLKKPMVFVSWHECSQFISKFNKLELGDWVAVLPAGEQWEYACRAGSDTRYCFGDEVGQTNRNYGYDEFQNRLSAHAWYWKDQEYNPFGGEQGLPATRATGLQPVGLKLPNAWGLFDMHGTYPNGATISSSADQSSKWWNGMYGRRLHERRSFSVDRQKGRGSPGNGNNLGLRPTLKTAQSTLNVEIAGDGKNEDDFRDKRNHSVWFTG